VGLGVNRAALPSPRLRDQLDAPCQFRRDRPQSRVLAGQEGVEKWSDAWVVLGGERVRPANPHLITRDYAFAGHLHQNRPPECRVAVLA